VSENEVLGVCLVQESMKYQESEKKVCGGDVKCLQNFNYET
jgi:hypothetical protein